MGNNMDNKEIAKKLTDLQKQIDDLTQRRVSQLSIIPGAIKSRHFGESNPYINSGLAADLPTEGFMPTIGTSVFFETDTGILNIWDGANWLQVTLS